MYLGISTCLSRITVTFNINNSIPPTFDGEEEPSQGQKAEEQEVSSDTADSQDFCPQKQELFHFRSF